MKKMLIIAAAVSLVASSAFGQADSEDAREFGNRDADNFKKTTLIVVSGGGDSPEAAAVTKAVRQEMERSRRLEPNWVDDDRGARLAAPISVQKDGQNLTVAYELRTARRFTQAAQVTCPVAKPANCARDIVVAAEKFVRVNKDR